MISERKENSSLRDPTFLALFQLLEHYFGAIEEMNFPFPPKFHTKFSVLGFHCLPRQFAYLFMNFIIVTFSPSFAHIIFSVFVQYLERGVFRMTDSFMNHIEHILGQSTDPQDAHIKFLMASKMARKKKALQLLRKFRENGPLMAENAIATVHNDDDSSDEDDESESQSAPLNVPEDLEAATEGEEPIPPNNFLPFVYYTQYLKTKGTKAQDLDFIRRTYGEHFKDI